jgi:uncharacterized protein (TIGR02217 family)
MTFHEVQFPTDIAYGAQGGPQYSTSVVITASGFEQRNSLWATSRMAWNVATGLKKQAQLDVLVAFFRARKGRAYGFRFKDWSDYQATAQALGTGDSVTHTFQLVKNYTSGPASEIRTIKKPVAGTVVVYLAGVMQSSGWSVDTTTGIVSFVTAPGIGVAVTADFQFDVPVRFDTDSMAATLENVNLSDWQNLPVIEIKV